MERLSDAENLPSQSGGHRSRLRDRFRKAGLEGFHDYEVVELLLTFAIPRRDVKPYAKALIKRFGGLRGVFDASLDELEAVPGIGPSAAIMIKFLKEAASLYLKERIRGRTLLDSPAAVIEYCRHSLVGERNELFRVIYLNPRDEILDIETVAEGTVDYTAVYPRKIIEGGLRHNAVGMVFVHNHPDGPGEPARRSPPVRSAQPTWRRSPGSPRWALTLPWAVILFGRLVGFTGSGGRSGNHGSRWRGQRLAIGQSLWNGPGPALLELGAPWARVAWRHGP